MKLIHSFVFIFRTSSKNHEKPESPIQVPLGYIELYDKETGLISYRDSNGILWHTNLDAAGKLYFYAKIGNEWRSEWRLPHVKKANDNCNKVMVKSTSFLTFLMFYIYHIINHI